MKHLLELYPAVAKRIEAPVLIVLGSPWPAAQLAGAVGPGATCFQFDLYAAARLREKLAQENTVAEVVTSGDLWDLPPKFRTAIYIAASHADYELKLDMVEQGFHVLEPGGLFITLSEYERDSTFAKAHKKVFGKCGESPRSEFGSAFWSTREGERPRRRHEVNFHAKIGDRPSINLISRPGTFSYGRMDEGSRALLEVADIRPGDRVLDLGCGNGAVGCLVAPIVGPTGSITFIDSSTRAVALSQLNAEANGVANGVFIASENLQELEDGTFDAVLANPPYYANSEVGRLFISKGREVLKPGGRFHFVTKMPVQTIPEIVESFGGGVESIENRGYTVVSATS